jgi:hypothetical protein
MSIMFVGLIFYLRQQNDYLVFPSANLQEFTSFCSFCSLQGHTVNSGGSLTWRPTFRSKAEESEHVLAHRKETGIDLTKPRPNGIGIPLAPENSVDLEGKSTPQVLAEFDDKSLIKKAIMSCISSHIWPYDAEVKSLSYSYRPYFQFGKRCEAVILEPHFKIEVARRPAPFDQEPSPFPFMFVDP